MNNPLQKAIKTIVRVAHPDKIILFGSRAKGTAKKNSDYDLLVLKKGIKAQRALAHKIYLHFQDIGAPIDVIVTSLKKFEHAKNDPYLIYQEADKNGKVIYEKS